MNEAQSIHRLIDLERALDHPETEVRLQVLQLITNNPQRALAFREPNRDVIDALDERIEREPANAVRVGMLTALVALGGDPRTVARMVREAQMTHGAMEQMLALSYLAQYDAERARPFARRLIFSQNRDQVRISARLLGEEPDFTPAERVRTLVVEPRPSQRQWNPPHVDALLRELQGPFMAGARELIEVHHPELVGTLVERWGDLDPATAAWLVEAADRLPANRDVGALLTTALSGSDTALHDAALEQLVRIDLAAVGLSEGQVRGFLSDPNPTRRLHALSAVGTVEDILELLETDVDDQLQAAALQRLARLHADLPTADWCQRWVEHPAWRVRSAAAILLARRRDLPTWLSDRWGGLSESGQVAVARAALEANRDQELEARFAGAWA